MGKRNRDKLLEQSMYDMLLKMNENLCENLRCTNVSTCIMDALYPYSDYSEYERIARCQKHKAACEKCLQSWMNEDPF
jgi:hypothetical protein